MEDDGDEFEDDEDNSHERAASPLAGKSKARVSEIRTRVPRGPDHAPLPSDSSDAATETETESQADTFDDEDEDEDEPDDSDEAYDDDDGDDASEAHAEPPALPTPKRAPRPSPALATSRTAPPLLDQAPSPIFERDVRARASGPGPSKLSGLAHELGTLRLSEPAPRVNAPEELDTDEDSMILRPAKKGLAKKKKCARLAVPFVCLSGGRLADG
jgi:hypothetical protein